MDDIVFVEDEVLLRGLLVDYFSRSGCFRVMGDFSDGRSALAGLETLRPDLLVLDLQLPDIHGSQLVEAVATFEQRPKMLVLTGATSPMMVRQLLRMGVSGVLRKGLAAEAVLQACLRVMRGAICLELPKEIEKDFQLEADGGSNSALSKLTRREMEIFELISQGLRAKEIAHSLSLSVRTVEKHRENLMRKTGARDNYGLIRCSLEAKISFPSKQFSGIEYLMRSEANGDCE